MGLIKLSEDDYYAEAVRTRGAADKNLKHFAECCANVSNKRTAALAADCKCSPDTIESYRNAYRLAYRLMVEQESEHARKLWEDAPIELWKAAAKLAKQYNLDNETIYEYLTIGNEHGMSRESFSAHVDEKENHVPKWIRSLKQINRLLLRDDWATEIPYELQDEYRQAKEHFANVLERIAQEMETE